MTASPLVTCAWLNDQLSNKEAAAKIRILDCSFHPKEPGRDAQQEYGEKHIPGAVFYNVPANTDHESPIANTMPKAAQFAEFVGQLGVGEETHVICYDASRNMNGFFSTPRVWFLFRAFGHDKVSILDGGLNKWLASGYETTADASVVKPKEFKAKLRRPLTLSLDELKASTEKSNFLLIDARAANNYSGKDKVGDLLLGCVPTFPNVPFSELVDFEAKQARSIRSLTECFLNHGLEVSSLRDMSVYVMCNTGMVACCVIFALYLLGKLDAGLYDGSWTEISKTGSFSDKIVVQHKSN